MPGSLKDSLNYASKWTLRKAWNAGLVYASYHLSRATKKTRHWGQPISLSIEPTTSCNLRCPQCPSGLRSFTRPKGMLQGDLFQQLIDQQASTLTYLTLYFQGEPFLNPDFLAMVKYASDKRIYTATSTNAHYLDAATCDAIVESGLDRLIISIDGVDQEAYGKYRLGGKLDKVLEGTKAMMEAKKRAKGKGPFVIWQFIVFSHNEHQLPDIKRLAEEYEVDELAIKTAQIYDFEEGSNLIPQQEKYSRYELVTAGFRIKNKLLNHCWRMWQACVITWDGLVVPCCFDKDATHRMGDLKQTSFNEVWTSKPYQDFRNAVLKGRSNIDICRNCTEGTKVWEA